VTTNFDKNTLVAFLGPRGTFSEIAVRQHFGDAIEISACKTIDEVFASVESQRCHYGVVPVENSTEGAVNNTQDCLIDSQLHIAGEQVVVIDHCLLAQPGVELSEMQTIASHQQSLAQCRKWLSANLPAVKLVECTSNAEAARIAQADKHTAAIAGALAADIYGLNILARKIQDQPHNSTRFLILGNTATSRTGNDKTSILIYTENRPGALFRILEPFENLGVSLTRIETRPSKKEAWAYVFFIDFEGHVEDKIVKELFSRLQACTAEIKVLGSYPRAK